MILIIDKKTLTIVSRYEGNRSRQSEYGGEWADPEQYAHIHVDNLAEFDSRFETDQELKDRVEQLKTYVH